MFTRHTSRRFAFRRDALRPFGVATRRSQQCCRRSCMFSNLGNTIRISHGPSSRRAALRPFGVAIRRSRPRSRSRRCSDSDRRSRIRRVSLHCTPPAPTVRCAHVSCNVHLFNCIYMCTIADLHICTSAELQPCQGVFHRHRPHHLLHVVTQSLLCQKSRSPKLILVIYTHRGLIYAFCLAAALPVFCSRQVEQPINSLLMPATALTMSAIG